MKIRNELKCYLLPFIILIMIIILNNTGIIDLRTLIGENSESIHFNLITVNAIFAGFLFTAITFFIGVNTTKTVEVLERIDYMDKVYKNLNMGFIASLISIILSLVSIFVFPAISNVSWIYNYVFIKCIVNVIIPAMILMSLVYTIIKFLIALKHLNFIISSIRRKSKLSAPSRESIEETLKKIK